ncbi:MAG TPA: N-acetylmuramic acid 6-phosphate etherase [Gaiellaceae bacterium]|jgi:N-acetylmuramic acid 6-phosphate etherase
MTAFEQLGTEARDAAGADLDLRSTAELVELMNEEDATVPTAVGGAGGALAALIDDVAARLASGGRLLYIGAGTSGRLAALDAVECQATFSVAPDRVVALVAGEGAETALRQEAAEDDADAGRADVERLAVGERDAVVGISASGRSPYVLAALEQAGERGAFTGCVVSVEGSDLAAIAEREVCIPVGPEVLAGSTRLKAGTAQKLVLNMISTISMIRLGKTYGNLMVDLVPSNEKLRARAVSVVRQAASVPADEAEAALERAGGNPKVAIVSLLAGVDPDEARTRLAAAGGVVRRALGPES